MLVAYKLLNIEARLTCEESDVMACYATKVVEQIFAPFGCRLLHVFNDAMILSLYMRAFFFHFSTIISTAPFSLVISYINVYKLQ